MKKQYVEKILQLENNLCMQDKNSHKEKHEISNNSRLFSECTSDAHLSFWDDAHFDMRYASKIQFNVIKMKSERVCFLHSN